MKNKLIINIIALIIIIGVMIALRDKLQVVHYILFFSGVLYFGFNVIRATKK